MKNDERECDYLIVLGCGLNGQKPSLSLKYRLDKAVDYLNTYPNSTAILCGGQGAGEEITEALAMYTYLINNGINNSRLVLEDNSKDTTQNIRYAKNIIDSIDASSNPTVAIISNDFHIYRAKFIADKEGLKHVYGIPAKTPDTPFLKINLHLREYFSIIFEYLNV